MPRHPSPLRVALIAMLGATALSGCARVPPADLSRDPAALLDQVRAAQERVQRVRGSARVRIVSPGGSGTFNEFAAAEKPDRVHLETLDFFGNPAAVLVAAGGRFSFLDARAQVFYRGEATPENVSRLLPVLLPVEELVTILCGSAPLLPGRPVEVGTQGDLLLLTVAAGDTGQRLALGEAATVEWSRVRRVVTEGGGRREIAPAYDLEFQFFRRRSGVRFPTFVRLDAPSANSVIELTWRNDLEVDATLDAALFRLAPPRGVRVVDLAPGQPAPPVELPIEPAPPRE
jgi:hypothetical protein